MDQSVKREVVTIQVIYDQHGHKWEKRLVSCKLNDKDVTIDEVRHFILSLQPSINNSLSGKDTTR